MMGLQTDTTTSNGYATEKEIVQNGHNANDEAPKSEESTSESTAAKPEDSCAATANQSTDAPTEDVSQDDKADSKKKPASEKKKRSKSFLKAFTLKKKHDPVPKAEPETVNQTETEKPPETVEQAEVKPEETQETAETPQPETEMKDATQTAEVPASDKTEEKPEAEAEAVPMGEIEKTDPTEKAGPPKKKGFFKFLKRTPKTSPPAECTAPKAEEAKEEEKPSAGEDTTQNEEEPAKLENKPAEEPKVEEKPAEAEVPVAAAPETEKEELKGAVKTEGATEATADEAPAVAAEEPAPVATEEAAPTEAEGKLPNLLENLNLDLLESSDIASSILEEQLEEIVENTIKGIQNAPKVLEVIFDSDHVNSSEDVCNEPAKTSEDVCNEEPAKTPESILSITTAEEILREAGKTAVEFSGENPGKTSELLSHEPGKISVEILSEEAGKTSEVILNEELVTTSEISERETAKKCNEFASYKTTARITSEDLREVDKTYLEVEPKYDVLVQSDELEICSDTGNVKFTTTDTSCGGNIKTPSEVFVENSDLSTTEVERSERDSSLFVQLAHSVSNSSDHVNVGENEKSEAKTSELAQQKCSEHEDIAESEKKELEVSVEQTINTVEGSLVDPTCSENFSNEVGFQSSVWKQSDPVVIDDAKIDEDSSTVVDEFEKNVFGMDRISGTAKPENTEPVVAFEMGTTDEERFEDSDDDDCEGFSASEIESDADIVRSATLVEVDCDDDIKNIVLEPKETQDEKPKEAETSAEPAPEVAKTASEVAAAVEPAPEAEVPPVESTPEADAPVDSTPAPESGTVKSAPVESDSAPVAAPVEPASAPVESEPAPEASGAGDGDGIDS